MDASRIPVAEQSLPPASPDGETARWNREDFIGVLDDKFLPDWARKKLEELMTQEQDGRPHYGRYENEVREDTCP